MRVVERVIATFVGVLAMLGGAAVTHAQPTSDDRPIVMLVDPRGPLSGNHAAQKALERLRRAIGEIGARAPDRALLGARRDARIDPSVLATAIGHRERAEQSFRMLQANVAIRALEDAAVLHQRRFCDVFGDEEAARAARLSAFIYRFEARPLRMRDEMRRAITFDPETPANPGQYPPDFVQEYETERQYLLASGIPVPTPTRLCEAARLVGAAAIATVATDATTVASLALDVYNPETCARRAVTLPVTGNDEDARRAASAILVPPPIEVVQTIPVVPPPVPAALPTTATTPTPWWARWYTIAGAGAIVAGGVLAAVLLTAQPDEFPVDTAQQHGMQ